MEENVELYYFPSKALGEGLRLLLAYGGQEFKDHRIAKEQWPEFKPKTLLGRLPELVIDGRHYAQSVAIARFLGQKFRLAGADHEENLEIDQNIDYFNDIRAKAAEVFYETNEDLKKEKQEENLKTLYPFMLDKLNKFIVKNNGHLALGILTWGDFYFAGSYDYFKRLLDIPDIDTKYPAFKQLQDKVLSLPQLKEYLEKAPKTDF